MRKIMIGVPCLFDKKEALCETIRSFLDPEVAVVAIDNGATDDCKEALSELEEEECITVVHNHSNVFVNPAWNQIAELFLLTTSEILVIANSDIVLSPGWVEYLLRAAETQPERFWLGRQVAREQLSTKFDAEVEDLPHIFAPGGSWGSFFALRRRDVERCFPIPNDLKVHLGDDWVFSFLPRTGVFPSIVNNVRLWHAAAVNVNQLSEADSLATNDRHMWHNHYAFACKRAADAAIRGSKMSKLAMRYASLRDSHSDINEHLPTIRAYASQCDHVTEFGFGQSTCAIAYAHPKVMRCYDPTPDPARAAISEIIELARSGGIDITFSAESDLTCRIEQTEMLFIDTIHTFVQLRAELDRHADSVLKFILMHDTEVFGEMGEDRTSPGLNEAVDSFLISHLEWELLDRFRNNNGLTVLKRREMR